MVLNFGLGLCYYTPNIQTISYCNLYFNFENIPWRYSLSEAERNSFDICLNRVLNTDF